MTLPHDHIVRSFGEELRGLRDQVIHMWSLVLRQVDEALEVLTRHDAARAAQVVAADAEIDRCEREIERCALRLIALRQPRAQDLRMTVSAMKIAHSLERTGDIAKSMARRVSHAKDARTDPELSGLIAELGRQVSAQHGKVFEAYKTGDVEHAMAVWASDAAIDARAEQLSHAILTQMARAPADVSYYAQLLFVAKNLERVGDHATNLAECVRYEVTGEETLEHRPRAEAPAA